MAQSACEISGDLRGVSLPWVLGTELRPSGFLSKYPPSHVSSPNGRLIRAGRMEQAESHLRTVSA